MDYQSLIQKLKQELSTKNAPGPILDSIMFRRLEKFSKGVQHNHELLLVGAILGDIRIDEARAKGAKDEHVEMALEYAQELFNEYNIPNGDQTIIKEIIATHHGGEQQYIESKIYKNADNFKFLEPKGCLHFFGAIYTTHTLDGLRQSAEIVKGKLDEKLSLTDLNEKVIQEAKLLYEKDVEMMDYLSNA